MPGHIYRRRFSWRSSLKIPEQDEVESCLTKLWANTHIATYDVNPIDFIEARFDVSLRARQTKAFVCSAYAACVYACLGAIPSDINWDTFLPRDFKPGGRIDVLLEQNGIAKLGPLELIK